MSSKKQKIETVEAVDVNIADLFARISFFNDLDKATIGRFVHIATFQNFQHDETIVLAGDTHKSIFFITKGVAKILSDSKSSRGSILSLLGIGDFFGEIHLLGSKEKSNFSLKAEGECQVLIFRGKEFMNEVMQNQKLFLEFLKEEVHKLSKAYMQIAIFSMNTIRGRFISCLMLFIDEMGVRTPWKNGQSVVKLKNCPAQHQFAAMCGTSRETMNREIASLIKEGYIEWDGRDLVLLKELNIEN